MSKIAHQCQVRKVCFAGPIWVGVDVHGKSYAVAVRDQEGRAVQFTMSADNDAFVRKIASYGQPVALVAYEAGPCGYSLYHACEAAGITALVTAPSRIPRPVTRGNKTDRLDCRKLADYAARDMLVPVSVPTEEEEMLRGLQRRHHGLTDRIRATKQHIKSMLLEYHIEEPHGLAKWSKASVEALKHLALGAALRDTLDSYLRELAYLEAERHTVDQSIAKATPQAVSQRMRILQSVPGVGSVLAMTFACEIFRPERFVNSERLNSYVGLAPVVRQSGATAATGSLVRTGQQRLRSLLVECAWVHKGRDAGAESLYRRILSRTGLVQKAIVAVARRLLTLLWRLCSENRVYIAA
jgi:transposase